MAHTLVFWALSIGSCAANLFLGPLTQVYGWFPWHGC